MSIFGLSFLAIEAILLVVNLIVILIMAILRKRIAVIVLVSIAVLQTFLLHWNSFFKLFLLFK